MSTEIETPAATIGAEITLCEEVPMVRRDRWEEIRRLWVTERVPIAEIARRLDLDRKTVRRCLHDTAWQPYHRPARPERLLTPHIEIRASARARSTTRRRSCFRSSSGVAIRAATRR